MTQSPRILVVFTTLLLISTSSLEAQRNGVSFAEEFALADDRAAVLEQLIPGTDDYYYYHALERQLAGAYEDVPPILKTWISRYGRNARVIEIENRQALLRYDDDPIATFRFLVMRLGLDFDHRPATRGAPEGVPSRLDQKEISFDNLAAKNLLRTPGSLERFTDSGLAKLVHRDLDANLLRQLLDGLNATDVGPITDLVLRDLRSETSNGFGRRKIHGLLTRSQLADLAQQMPALLGDDRFVMEYLLRLQPSADVSLESNATERSAYLDRLLGFVRTLPPSQNSLKAHVIHHRLREDLRRRQIDRELFMEYLRLPRRTPYVNDAYLRRMAAIESTVDPSRPFMTRLPAIGADEMLVRRILETLLAREDSISAYESFLDKRWLERVFAEIKILTGADDKERWYSLLDDAGYYEELRERVEIEFAPDVRDHYREDDAVVLPIELKNVETLLVKVYEVNAASYYRDFGKEIDASIKIEGLVASHEATLRYEASPFLRIRREIELAGMEKPGTYVVELIGNGLSSRAVIRKGRLRAVERLGIAGQVLRVYDESEVLQKNARVRIGSEEFVADDDGEIHLPFATSGAKQTAVLISGSLASLDQIQRKTESFKLAASFFVDRESLIAGNRARVLVRSDLLLHDESVDIGLLKNTVLTLTTTDKDGISSKLEIRDPVLRNESEFAFDFDVPARLRSLAVMLTGQVRIVSRNENQDLSAHSGLFQINGELDTDITSMPYLGKTREGYVVDVLGLNGEPQVDQAFSLHLKHRDFNNNHVVSLKTDESGRIHLGALEDIEKIEIRNRGGKPYDWNLEETIRTYPRRIHIRAGDSAFVPLVEPVSANDLRSHVACFEIRGNRRYRDCIEQVFVQEGFLELRGLEAGDYALSLKDVDDTIAIHVAAGRRTTDWVLGESRFLELFHPSLLSIQGVTRDGDDLVIQLVNQNAATRVHLIATRYLPPFEVEEILKGPGLVNPAEVQFAALESTYDSGRKISDEYRYILERRFATKFPGNMLQRPSLLLNPWALDETNSVIGLGGGAGGAYGGRRGGGKSARRGRGAGGPFPGASPAAFASLEFLPQSSKLLSNLEPDQDGRIRVPLADLGDGQIIHALAISGSETVYDRSLRDELQLEPRDLRLDRPLAQDAHFAEQRGIEFVDAGETAVIADRSTTRLEYFDDLASVFRLMKALRPGRELDDFSFIVDWPAHDLEKKNELYSRHACHELHFFLKQKDPAYFDAVVRPYLENKATKTFLDDYLLEKDLGRYTTSWAFSQLNLVERILLTRRLDAKRAGGRRHVEDLFGAQARDLSQLDRLFSFALASNSLTESQGGLEKLLSDKMAETPELGAVAPTKKPARFSADEKARSDEEAEEIEPEGLVEDRVEIDEEAMDDADELEDFAESGRRQEELRKNLKNKDRALREDYRAGYQAPGKTQRLAESNYWHRTVENTTPDMIAVNAFWLDFARNEPGTPFFSTHFLEASSNFSEIMFALALLDLPFEAGEHRFEVEGKELRFQAGSPLILAREELRPTTRVRESSPILVSQFFFRSDDPFVYEGQEKRDKYVTKEFLTGVPYSSRVVLTNPSSSSQKLELLLQIPEGAIPLQGGFETKGMPIELGAYGTTTTEFQFYFPSPGDFRHYPVHANQGGELVAFAKSIPIKVVRELSEVDTQSWEHLSQSGTKEQVLAFLDQANLERIDLSKIAWRLRDRDFFVATHALVSARHAFDRTPWSYGIHHAIPEVTREYLNHADEFVASCGSYLDTPLLVIDPVARKRYQHLEFDPLFHGRAHQFGKRREILDQGLLQQYSELMDILSRKSKLDADDRMTITYYLLLQDRVEEALSSFARVQPESLETRIQYDYMRAYLDFFSPEHALARGIAQAYLDHPVERWRHMFRNVVNQLDEAEGKIVAAADPDDRDQNQAANTNETPTIEMKVESREIRIRHAHLASCEIGLYEMDVEFLFSSNPFVEDSGGTVAYVRPNRSMTVKLDESGQTSVALPEDYANSNLLVEVRAGGLVQRQTYFASSLGVQVFERYGQVRISNPETEAPLPRVYVKVFAREANGQVRFHKDGYTDIRGRFDYASLSGPDSTSAERFAILILSEERGAVIRSVDAPLP